MLRLNDCAYSHCYVRPSACLSVPKLCPDCFSTNTGWNLLKLYLFQQQLTRMCQKFHKKYQVILIKADNPRGYKEKAILLQFIFTVIYHLSTNHSFGFKGNILCNSIVAVFFHLPLTQNVSLLCVTLMSIISNDILLSSY